MKNTCHIPKEIQFLVIEEEQECERPRPELFLPSPTVLSRSGFLREQVTGQGGLYA